MKQPKHWQDPVNALLGAWFALSPWVLGFQHQMALTANSVVLGVLLIAAALGAYFLPRAWEEWSEGVLGVLMIVSPWVMGFSAEHNAMLSAVISGVLVLVLAAWVLVTDESYSSWRHHGATQ